MAPPNIQEDAHRLFKALSSKDHPTIALVPSDIGYALMTTNKASLERIFSAKNRVASKRHPLMGTMKLLTSLLILTPTQIQILKTLSEDFRIPVAVVARFREDHPMVKQLEERGTLEESTGIAAGEETADIQKKKTLMVTTAVGPLCMALCAICETPVEEGGGGFLPLQGSSANPSGTGNRYRLEDIPADIRELADVEFDHGLARYGPMAEGKGATILDFSEEGDRKKIGVWRVGVCYETIRDMLDRFWGIEVPEDPGQESAKFGQMKSLPDMESLKALRAGKAGQTS